MRRKGQRGYALILVLIALALGSSLITPALSYVSTGFVEARSSQGLMLRKYALDAAVEYSLWQLKYNVGGLADQLGLENPSSSTTVTVGGIEVPVTTQISDAPQKETGAYPKPPSESGIHLFVSLEIKAPYWSPSGKKAYLTHVVYIYNYGSSSTHLKTLFQKLDPRLEYVPASYDGPRAKLTTTYVNDHQELLFEFKTPLPKLESQESMLIVFTTWTEGDMGEVVYSGSGWVTYAGFLQDEIVQYSGESGASAWGLYDVSATIGSYTLLVNAGLTEEGEVVLRSYQFQ